ncbi:sodium- and chloride-dependent neutral and basic amino acid transporter B(0+) isoform X1 [Athene cunicularia]|uniref:sodium- and chloride-dependent neutral and basic amino acid transporter B(0+) isoform X1 n=1 Tax=Athene cunicularia TaxID=194338 RepID=UPI000EF65421|nr:sodium- and chloride-dependent neutral and basic amino acid transporter B(0+) isoform X1 [Athene cunicularia]
MGMLNLPSFLSCGKKKDFSLSNEKDAHASDSDENSERGNWSNKGDYLLSMVGYAVGLGNVWRFPYLTYQNGGGAFLIPYTLMLALAGLPLFFMECSLGQFASLGPISVWRILPLFQGVGITMVIISTFVAIYYNVIIAYALYYLFASFQKVLPWSDCFSWADEFCSKTRLVSDCNATLDGEIIHANYSFITSNNLTCMNGTMNYKPVQFPSEQYWNKVALQRSSGLDETGNIVWYLALCLLLSWMIVGAVLFKGIKSSGKSDVSYSPFIGSFLPSVSALQGGESMLSQPQFCHMAPHKLTFFAFLTIGSSCCHLSSGTKVVYFTALFPYVILLILLVRGATLEGALDGIEYYIGKQSNITKLMEAEVWKDAATQIFYSLSVAWGGLVALSSYNKFHNNCYSDAILVCVTNCLTSVFAGFAIFSILGHMAFVSERPVSEVVDSGFDLAFVAYPEALSKLPVSPLWSFLFFFMLLLLGLDSQFATIETLTTTIQDIYPKAMKKLRIPITLAVCILLFLLGLTCVTQAGIYWVNLIDHFCAGWGILIAAVLEIIGIIYIYGGNRFIEDIEMMIGKKSRLFWLWWRICWFFITPVLLMAILIWSLVTFSPPTYGSVLYPAWGTAVGWCMIIFCVIWIPVVAILKIVKAEGNLCQRIVSCCRPAANWGPYLACHRGERYSHVVDPKREKEHEIPTVSGFVYIQQ